MASFKKLYEENKVSVNKIASDSAELTFDKFDQYSGEKLQDKETITVTRISLLEKKAEIERIKNEHVTRFDKEIADIDEILKHLS